MRTLQHRFRSNLNNITRPVTVPSNSSFCPAPVILHYGGRCGYRCLMTTCSVKVWRIAQINGNWPFSGAALEEKGTECAASCVQLMRPRLKRSDSLSSDSLQRQLSSSIDPSSIGELSMQVSLFYCSLQHSEKC